MLKEMTGQDPTPYTTHTRTHPLPTHTTPCPSPPWHHLHPAPTCTSPGLRPNRNAEQCQRAMGLGQEKVNK